MKMADIKVGMRLVSTLSPSPVNSPITVTELTPRGFKYRLDAPATLRPGQIIAMEGHEHYGHNGEAFYEIEG